MSLCLWNSFLLNLEPRNKIYYLIKQHIYISISRTMIEIIMIQQSNIPEPPVGISFVSHAGYRISIPGRDKPKSLKHVVTDTFPNSHYEWHCRRRLQNKQMYRVTVGVDPIVNNSLLHGLECRVYITIPFYVKVYFSVWVKHSRVWRKTTYKQTNNLTLQYRIHPLLLLYTYLSQNRLQLYMCFCWILLSNPYLLKKPWL